jgi:hypothetical protein
MKWEAWEEYRGKSKEFSQKVFIIQASRLFTEEDLADLLINTNRPGPNYYSECKEWNWTDQLVLAHKTHLENNGVTNMYGIDMTDAELKEM